ncbi:MAG: acetyl/propionyl/methylcrotonyl-CoA carboxylase subunit alpha [Rhodospirillales bacterium]|nr:acetyl/propionyl/methylcrotonyl-CoA carboxylase subunit alpha [Rhodospirillales bacterium]MDH3969277.1 acetyl/propionyl/methylcrotonyl-CoA carboxylase subunit alpha [Rhodospirillales bacterium]
MFDKILIANRGEIACRIIKTARRMGIQTVAVYSEADAGTLHVELADEAVLIGPPAAAESYLVIEKIVQACKDSGAQAVHPGFGFLAENAGFVEALEAAGIAFIGPATRAIAAMGDKIESKKLAAEAQVNTVPGHMDLIEDAEQAVRISREVGYPVMIKASAGGGGKGMRIARDDGEAREGFRSARSEAKSSFADDRVFIEKFIEEPRHIEIQVLADTHGNAVYLGERECSIQRRHQKVIEEAPSPFLDEETRAAMGAQAVALAQAVDYRSAGTVEFIVDLNRNFYFLEMNTRIQVEHPVTEMITGLDLVEWMIRVAAGETLGFGQDEVRLDGWAMEARIYAEDPTRNFMPSIGRLVRYIEPEAGGLENGCSVRVDSGVVEGSEISMFYDPMIAKLVTHGPDRPAAIAAMQAALDGFAIRGIAQNTSFLAAVLAHERFHEGRLTTNFIAEEFPDGFHGGSPAGEVLARLLAVAVVLQRVWDAREARISGQLAGRAKTLGDDWVVVTAEDSHPVTLSEAGAGDGAGDGEGAGYRVSGAAGERLVESAWRPGQALFRGRIDGRPVTVQVDRRGPWWQLTHGGARLEALVLTARVAELAARMPRKEPPDLSRFLLSPMPGLLVSLAVGAGQEVKAGEELAVVEAMKMENVLRAQRDGVVAKVHAEAGASLAVDQAILEFE